MLYVVRQRVIRNSRPRARCGEPAAPRSASQSRSSRRGGKCSSRSRSSNFYGDPFPPPIELHAPKQTDCSSSCPVTLCVTETVRQRVHGRQNQCIFGETRARCANKLPRYTTPSSTRPARETLRTCGASPSTSFSLAATRSLGGFLGTRDRLSSKDRKF